MKVKKSGSLALKKTIDLTLKGNANSTTCGYVYQPKAPTALKKFNKVNNDK